MKLFLTKNRILKGDSSLIGYCRENKCECLNIQVMDSSLWTKQAFLEFQVNEGEKYTTEALDMSSGVISYKVPNGLLIEKGKLKMQVVIRDGEVVQKSSIKEFTINEAICAGDDVVIEYPTGGGSSSVVDLSEYEDGDTLPQEIVNKLLKEDTLVLYKLPDSSKILLTTRMIHGQVAPDEFIQYRYTYVELENNLLRSGVLEVNTINYGFRFYSEYDEFESVDTVNDKLSSKMEVVVLSHYKNEDKISSLTVNKLVSLQENGRIFYNGCYYDFYSIYNNDSETQNHQITYTHYETSSEEKYIAYRVMTIFISSRRLVIDDFGETFIPQNMTPVFDKNEIIEYEVTEGGYDTEEIGRRWVKIRPTDDSKTPLQQGIPYLLTVEFSSVKSSCMLVPMQGYSIHHYSMPVEITRVDNLVKDSVPGDVTIDYYNGEININISGGLNNLLFNQTEFDRIGSVEKVEIRKLNIKY